jgi:hypothetical protein
MVAFATVMVPLAKAFGLAVVAERILELGKNLLEPRLSSRDTRAQPDAAATRRAVADVQARAQRDAATRAAEQAAEQRAPERSTQSAQLHSVRDRLFTESDPAKRAALLKQAGDLSAALTVEERHGEWEERVPTSVLLVQDASDPDDGWTLRSFVLQLLGFAAGILLASFADLRLFSAFLTGGGGGGGSAELPGWVDHVFTGLFIGGGSGPVHTLIEFVTARRTIVQAAELTVAETAADKAFVTSSPPEVATWDGGWVDVPYAGGVDVDLLQSVHRRDADPTIIVYHHTGMSSDSTFDDVVRVIKSGTDGSGQPWLTGYHCVILADGSAHAFCRWDRYGSHAAGFNLRSLGLGFNGNFETNPSVPFANPDGRYGATRPTEPQLRAGARVAALWTFLYRVPVDFERGIIPHRQIAGKSCAGSNFPYDDFKKLVTFYRRTWEQSALAQERITAFKLKPYLYV